MLLRSAYWYKLQNFSSDVIPQAYLSVFDKATACVSLFSIWLPVRSVFRIHWRLLTILKTSKKAYEVMFLKYKSIYILKLYSMLYTLRWNTNATKIFLENMHSSFRELELSKGSILNSKCRIFQFWFCFGFIKVSFFVQEKHGPFTSKHHNSLQN